MHSSTFGVALLCSEVHSLLCTVRCVRCVLNFDGFALRAHAQTTFPHHSIVRINLPCDLARCADAKFQESRTAAVEGQVLVLSSGEAFAIEGQSDGAHVLCLSGQPINEEISRYGPFVMNTRDEIIQAIKDYNNGVLAKPIAGSELRRQLTENARKQQMDNGNWKDEL
jgi:hypothetical protein